MRPENVEPLFDARIARVHQKLRARDVLLDPPLAERQVLDFQVTVGVRLPEAYRRFLLHIGDGPREDPRFSDWAERKRRLGPPFHGLYPLERTLSDGIGNAVRP